MLPRAVMDVTPAATATDYVIRPYDDADKMGVYEVCLKTGDAGQDGLISCFFLLHL